MYEGQLKARNELIESMKRELLGPGSEPNCIDLEREVISANPEKRYALGILFPQGNMFNMEDDDTVSPDDSAQEDIIEDDVLKYIAEKFSNDVRQLEGALNKLLFTAISFNNNSSITMSDAIDSFKLIGTPGEKKTLTIEKIKIVVAEYYNISPNELSSKIRTSKITMVRHIAMYLCRDLLNVSLSQIGNEFGGRDHTTVINGIEKVEKLCKTNEDYLIAVNELKSRLK